jgi:hypothetical protein
LKIEKQNFKEKKKRKNQPALPRTIARVLGFRVQS